MKPLSLSDDLRSRSEPLVDRLQCRRWASARKAPRQELTAHRLAFRQNQQNRTSFDFILL